MSNVNIPVILIIAGFLVGLLWERKAGLILGAIGLVLLLIGYVR